MDTVEIITAGEAVELLAAGQPVGVRDAGAWVGVERVTVDGCYCAVDYSGGGSKAAPTHFFTFLRHVGDATS